MGKAGDVKREGRLTRWALSALLILTMAAATLQIGAGPVLAGQASLTWTAPTTNTDGTKLTDLAGYKVHIGNATHSYQQNIDVGTATSYLASNLTDGSTYYFAVTAYDTSGLESSYSNEVTKSLVATTHLITATSGSGGSITAVSNSNYSVATSGTTTITSVKVSDGANQSFSIAPASGYSVSDVKVDGTSVGAVTSYTFSTVKADHTLSATFAANASYTISASAGTGGSITPSGTATLTSGASQSYTIAPASGYAISSVTVDGTSVGAVSSYSFSNVTANHTIQASFSATSTTSPSSAATFAVNSGGPAYTSPSGISYLADGKFTGGNVGTTTATITGTTEAPLYQTERYGNFSYSIPVANGSYNVTLKFAEIYFSTAGSRVFSVTVNGATAVSNLDIYSKVGKNAAYDVVVPVTVTNGVITVNFTSSVNNAEVHGIKVTPSSAPATGTVAFAANSGGSSFTDSTGVAYKADTNFTGGAVGTFTSAISGTSDDTLYQTERYGNFSYSIPVANGNYNVTLKFAESYFAASGKRVFNVAIGGSTVISNLDIYAKVGQNAAYDVVVPVSVTNGTLKIDFTSLVNNAEVRGILVKGA